MKRTFAASCIWLALAGLPAAGAPEADSPLARALDDLAGRLDEQPRDAGLLNDYGNLLVHAGFLDAAEAAYRDALAVDPDSLAASYNLGLLELELGRPRAAQKRFHHAIELDPSFGRAHYGLGAAFDARDRNRRAVKHYSRAFHLDPELLDVRSNPEILFNKLTSWASMSGYLAASPGRFGRLYKDPRPIVGLLIPGLDELRQRTDGEPAEPATAPADEGPAAVEAPAPDEVPAADGQSSGSL